MVVASLRPFYAKMHKNNYEDNSLVHPSQGETRLEKEIEDPAVTLAQKPPLALRLIKEGLEKILDMSLRDVLDWEAAHQSIALQTPEHKEIINMFMEAKGKDS